VDAPLNLFDLTREELVSLFSEWGSPRHTGHQVFQWLYRKKAGSFAEMTDLPKALREELARKAVIPALKLHARQISSDGTAKYLWLLPEGETGKAACVESVLIPASKDEEGKTDRFTACLSTQSGCRMKCAFCATGVPKFNRNLSPGEMVGQMMGMERDSGASFSNVVFMGMGEPLDNYDNTGKAVRILHDPEGFNLGRRRVTVSTSGLIEPLKRFIKDDWPASLAVSLHSADDEIRNKLVPINRSNPLEALRKLLRKYTFVRRLPVTLEYVLLKDINDGPADAQKLEVFCRDLLCKVNLIRYNPVPTLPFEAPGESQVEAFWKDLKDRGMKVFLRERKGADIAAACGQLGYENTPVWTVS
jgi:23S rRNA (adenine2503-C2)-methyltransferase